MPSLAKQEWLETLISAKFLASPSKLLSLPPELLDEIISYLDASALTALGLSAYVHFQHRYPRIFPLQMPNEWIRLRLICDALDDPDRNASYAIVTAGSSLYALPAELLLAILSNMSSAQGVRFILANYRE